MPHPPHVRLVSSGGIVTASSPSNVIVAVSLFRLRKFATQTLRLPIVHSRPVPDFQMGICLFASPPMVALTVLPTG